MKNKYIKLTLEILGLQVFFAVLAMFFMPFFSWMNNWEIIFSVITSWLFLGAVHSTFWQLGRKDKKNNVIANNHISNGEPKIKLSLLGGAKGGIVALIINVAVILVSMILSDGIFSDIFYNIHRILIGAMFGFLPSYSTPAYWGVSSLLCVIIYITGVIGYISGVYDFSITERVVPKIMYKTKNNKNG